MRIYIICAVRGAPPERVDRDRAYAQDLRNQGHHVFFPPDDAPQQDHTGKDIVAVELAAILRSDEVHVLWNVESRGSHFDLGMAYAMGKRIVPVRCDPPDQPDKASYWKVIST